MAIHGNSGNGIKGYEKLGNRKMGNGKMSNGKMGKGKIRHCVLLKRLFPTFVESRPMFVSFAINEETS